MGSQEIRGEECGATIYQMILNVMTLFLYIKCEILSADLKIKDTHLPTQVFQAETEIFLIMALDAPGNTLTCMH